jgi:hypothetical protein
MKTEGPPIARLELVRIAADGRSRVIMIELGQPYHALEGEWRTPVALHGLDGRLADICGEDSLQSLSLAVQMVHSRLSSIITAGDQLTYPDGSEFPFDTYFLDSQEG